MGRGNEKPVKIEADRLMSATNATCGELVKG